MTTNAYDFGSGVLASDSRWSADADGYLFYADNVGYEKIVYDTRLAILFAGHLNIIDEWKRWFIAGREGRAPGVTSYLSLCVIDVKTGMVRMDHGVCLKSPCTIARFAGTGAPHAERCWATNKSAIRSIETALILDMKSGGQVSYLNRAGLQNNLKNHSSVNQVMLALSTKGEMIMLNGNQKQIPVSIKDAIKDPAVNDAFMKVKNGGAASLGAPFMGMGTAWTPEEERNLYNILAEYPPEQKA